MPVSVGSVVQHYKGAEGGIRAVACHPTEDIVLSCGLDRYLRIHDINTRHLIQKVCVFYIQPSII